MLAHNQWAEEMNLMSGSSGHSRTLGDSSSAFRVYFRDRKRPCFVAFDLPVYYPNQNSFCPDLLVVFDVEDHERSSWNIALEKRDLDFAFEVVSPSSVKRDEAVKVALYAQLGIPEYFYFNPETLTIKGFLLKKGTYEEVSYQKAPNQKSGLYSPQLDLYFTVEEDRLRFLDSQGDHLLFLDEMVDQERLEKEQALERAEKAEKALEKLEKFLREKGIDPSGI